MVPIKRLLKPTFLKPYLNKALPLLGESGGIAVFCYSDFITSVGTIPDGLTYDSPDAAIAPVIFDCMEIGRIVMTTGDDISGKQAQLYADFIAESLVEIIDRETARRSVAQETLEKYRELALLYEATGSLNTSLRLRDVILAILDETIRAVAPAELGLVFALEPGKPQGVAHTFAPSSDMNFSALVDTPIFKEIAAGSKGEVINYLDDDPRWHNELPEIRSLIIQPIMAPNHKAGCLALGSKRIACFDAPHLKRVATLASVAGVAMGNAYHFENMQTFMDSLLLALAEAIDARDPFTAGHSQRVARLAVALALVINEDALSFPETSFNDDEIHELYYAGLLHDIGKIGIREQVLTKHSRLPKELLGVISMRMALYSQARSEPWMDDFHRLTEINSAYRLSDEDISFVRNLHTRRFPGVGVDSRIVVDNELHCLLIQEGNLTPEERQEIERHPEESYRILQHIPFTENFKDLLTIIHQHHERLDGSGYPLGLEADEILFQSRMMAIVDIFDAITQERHYKPALPRDKALHVLQSEVERGKLDAQLVTLFKSNIDRIEQIAEALNASPQESSNPRSLLHKLVDTPPKNGGKSAPLRLKQYA